MQKSVYLSFFCCSLLSGLLSGMAGVLRPLGLIYPGLVFGFTMCCALWFSGVAVPERRGLGLIACSTVGYWLAIVATVLSIRLPGYDFGHLYGAISGALAGFVGAACVGGGVSIVIHSLWTMRFILALSLAGATLGVVFNTLGAWINDSTPFELASFFITYTLWQTGVAMCIAAFVRGANAEETADER